jgi:predicted RecB family nuclease
VILKNTSGTQQFSFWADSADEEEIIFNRLFDAIKNANETKEMTIYHYGNYEIQNLNGLIRNTVVDMIMKYVSLLKKACDLLKYFLIFIFPPIQIALNL